MQEKLENEGFIQGHESIDDMFFSFFPKRLNPLFKKRKKDYTFEIQTRQYFMHFRTYVSINLVVLGNAHLLCR